MKRKPIIGEILFDLNIGNAARGYAVQELTPVTVSNVGRKYFTCSRSNGLETTFKIDGWGEKTEYCRNHRLYEARQEWEDEKESGEIHAELRAQFGHCPPCAIPLGTLRAIKLLVDNV